MLIFVLKMVHNKACFQRLLHLKNTAKNLTKFVLIYKRKRSAIGSIRHKNSVDNPNYQIKIFTTYYKLTHFHLISLSLLRLIKDWWLYCDRVKWQHFILHGIRKSVCYAMSLTKQDIIYLHQHIPALCAGFLVIGLNYAPEHIRL